METKFTYFEPDPQVIEHLIRELNCHPVLARMLCARGVASVQQARHFLEPGFNTISDPYSLKDMDKAVERLFTAIRNREKLLIFGDFDADGVTSTALLSDFLVYCNADVSWYIPHRMKEGYSLQPDHIRMAVERDIDLIVTVDCGISSHEAVTEAQKEDIDVIITDHHEPGASLPDAVAVLDPKRNDCPSGLAYLAGVGVAFYLIMALRKHLRETGFWQDIKEPNLADYLDLFAIGTIGDMTPLVHDNRALCMAGLKKIRQGNRLGLKSLADIARVDLGKLDSDDISFKIVPRINAAGRISHARICVSQLTSPDLITAEQTAALLEQLNQKRQKIEQEIVAEIETRLAGSPELLSRSLLFMWDARWDAGVLGIAASRLSKKYGFPVILLALKDEEAVGSGRSINNINILDALTAHESRLEKFGGHAFAAGLTVKHHNLSHLSEDLDLYLKETYSKSRFQKSVHIDAVLDITDIDYELACEIDRLRPFGVGNAEPLFMCRNVNVVSSFIIGGSHRKLILADARDPAPSILLKPLNSMLKIPRKFPVFSQKLFSD